MGWRGASPDGCRVVRGGYEALHIPFDGSETKVWRLCVAERIVIRHVTVGLMQINAAIRYHNTRSRPLVGAITLDGRTAMAVLDEGLRVDSFKTFIQDHLAPMLRPGDVVIMDTLSTHKNPDAVAAIEATGAEVVFQPRYSPEFNAIEMCWSWLKHDLRRIGCRAIQR